jgi:hypothetical protein
MRRPALSISLSMSLLAFVLLAACSPALPVQPSGDPAAEAGQLVPDGDDRVLFQPYLGRALSWLVQQVGENGLLTAGEGTAVSYRLQPDNELARRVFHLARGEAAELDLSAALGRFDVPVHGWWEALDGEVVAWPPHALAERLLEGDIWVEEATGPVVEQWESQSELLLLAALNAHNAGDAAEAAERLAGALTRFDGTGFNDGQKTGDGYSLRPLTLALVANARMGNPVNEQVVAALLAQQLSGGGFPMEYGAAEAPAANTEATALAAYALLVSRQE